MTVRDFFSTILSSKKIEQFNNLKADVLAWRFYRVSVVDVDKNYYISLFKGMDYHKSKFAQVPACPACTLP